MASTITKVKAIRLPNATADYFGDKSLKALVECAHHMIVRGDLSFDGENLKVNTTSVNSVNTADYAELEDMLGYFDMPMDEYIKQSKIAFEDGVFTVSEGQLVCVVPAWAEKLSDACHDLGCDVDKIVDSAIKSLKGGGWKG